MHATVFGRQSSTGNGSSLSRNRACSLRLNVLAQAAQLDELLHSTKNFVEHKILTPIVVESYFVAILERQEP